MEGGNKVKGCPETGGEHTAPKHPKPDCLSLSISTGQLPPKCLRVQMSVSHRDALVTASCFSKQVLDVFLCAKTSLKSSKNAIIATGSEC